MSKENKKIGLLELFITIFKINAFTFGGGYTIVPVIRDEFNKGKGLIGKEEMYNIAALAQSGPGPMAVNTSLLVGYRLRGPIGAMVCLLASTLPCLIILSIMYYLYDFIRENSWVRAAFSCMGGSIAGVLLLTSIDMIKSALKKHTIFGLILMVGGTGVSVLYDLNTALIILFCGIAGLVTFSILPEEKIK